MRNKLYPFQGPRLVFLAVVMLSTFVVLVLRLYEFQFAQFARLDAAARENSVQSIPLPAPRGVIYDRYGIPLALNAAAFNVSVVPAELPDDDATTLEVLNRLSALIDVPATRAAADAAGKTNIRSLFELAKEGEGIAPYRPVVVATDIKQSVAQVILEDNQKLPGVHVEPVSVRLYPTSTTTSQIIGYLGPIGKEEADKLREQGYNPAFERVGYAGVEAFLEDDLAGKRGLLTQVVDVAGLPVRVLSNDKPQAGKNVRLTIDLALQRAAEQALTDRINIINTAGQSLVTTSGAVIAMNPNTGEILAMVSWPTYDNSRFARAIDGDYYLRIIKEPQTPLVNHAISSLYPPGSVWKLVTAVGVAQEKVIDPHAFLTDTGDLFVENLYAPNDVAQRQRFVCWLRTGHGQVDLVHGIAWSCDVYFYQVGGGNPAVGGLRPGGLGIDDLDRYATAFNIGVKTGIELPGEQAGRMPDKAWKRRNYGQSWSTGDTYNAAFGQGYVTITPLQLMTASAAIATGGTLYQPTIIHSFTDSEGNVLQPFAPKVQRTLVLPANGSPAVLNMREDMYIRGKGSLACVCEPKSPYNDPTSKEYDPNVPKCTQAFIDNYRGMVRVNDREVPYIVHVPYGYTFSSNPFLRMCDVNRINENQGYKPPFVDPVNFKYIQEGMLGAVTFQGGTANLEGRQAALGYVQVAGKTGTAEYCDDIALPLGKCIPGQWPQHAWYFGYAPYGNPEIAIVAFVYNSGDGSKNALPVVKAVMDCYFKLKGERSLTPGKEPSPCTPTQS